MNSLLGLLQLASWMQGRLCFRILGPQHAIGLRFPSSCFPAEDLRCSCGPCMKKSQQCLHLEALLLPFLMAQDSGREVFHTRFLDDNYRLQPT